MFSRSREVAVETRKRERADGDLIVDVAFTSAEPYERWWGVEVLDHNEASIRLDRLRSGAAVLYNHNWNALRGTHVAESIRVDKDQVLRGQVRVTSVTSEGRDTIGLIETGVLSKMSAGYQIHKVIEQTTKKDADGKCLLVERELPGELFERVLERSHREARGDRAAFRRFLDQVAGSFDRADDSPTVYRVVDWEPLENSFVTVPADNGVGVGRGAFDFTPAQADPTAQPATTTGATMADVQTAPAGQPAAPQPAAPAVDYAGIDPAVQAAARRDAIQKLAKANGITDQSTVEHWVRSGKDWGAIGDDLLRIKAENDKAAPVIDMSPREIKRYSLMRALRAAASRDWTKAGLELEANREVSKRMNKIPRSETAFFVPLDIMMRDLTGTARRDMDVAGTSGSNYLVGTNNLPGSFIDLLRNASVTLRMGITRLSGLVGNVTIPKMTAGNTAYWLADETTQITESQPTLGQVALSPKNVAALTEISHQLMQQSTPDAEQLILQSIARDLALAVDVGVLRGSGNSGQPAGIVGLSGVGSVTGTSLAAAGIVEFQSDVAAANALMPGCGYVTTPAVAALLMVRPELPSTGTTRLWTGNLVEGQMFGFSAMASAQMSAATMLFGHWPSVVLGEWGVLELMTNPYSDFTRGLTAVRGWYTCDVAVRYPAAFSYASSIT